MTTFDTIKIQVNTDALKEFNVTKFQQYGEGGKYIKKGKKVHGYKVENIGHGVNGIKVDFITEKVTMRVSGKILKNDYFKGINTNTFGQVTDELNKTDFIQLDGHKLWNDGHIFTCDVVNHIPECPNYYGRLAKVPFDTKHQVQHFNTSRNKGIVIHGTQTSFKERQIHYNKTLDLMKDTQSRKFLSECNANALMKDFEGKVRIETNIVNFKRIRAFFDVFGDKEPNGVYGAPRIEDVFTSTQNVNQFAFSKLTKNVQMNLLQMFDQYDGIKLSHELKIRGMKGIMEDLQNDWKLIERYIRHRSPRNYRNVRKEFKKHYNGRLEGSYDVNIVQYITDELQKCA